MKKTLCLVFLYLQLAAQSLQAQTPAKLFYVGEGWANNSINTVAFRKNSIVTWRDTQFVAYYDADQYVVLGKRKQGTENWIIRKTGYRGKAEDAHNAISIMADGNGFLHVAWDHHNNSLHYCKSLEPGSLQLSPLLKMTGIEEQQITYPEFYRMKNGDLLFLYRSGESGRGNLVVNYYNTEQRSWSLLHRNLIDGEEKRNAYWQADVDKQGTVHISWVWRESADVSSNHDLCYARSKDGGETWENSEGEKYALPITSSTAEYALKIPERSELINQTSMSADETGNPFIATYWRDKGSEIPQYHIVYKKGSEWKVLPLNFRTIPFTLSGVGTKRIPIARPQLMMNTDNGVTSGLMIFRDEERKNVVSSVIFGDVEKEQWKLHDLTRTPVESWEPTYDTEYWKEKRVLQLFLQKTEQADHEGKRSIAPQPVYVLEYIPGVIKKE